MSEQSAQPGLISGHATYAKGAAVGAVGNVTGSDEWKKSGEEQKEAGLSEMKAAGAERDSEGTHGMGKVEEVAGKAVGCEGMEREGQASEK